MCAQWIKDDGTFHLGINMAGAVSAGAYTAGVLDFLTEALEQWYLAKGAANPAVPMHDVSIDVFSGASAGGMCAAISAAMLQGPFEHIRDPADPAVTGTTNRFYESWVNKIDIVPLLGTKDLAAGGPVVSLLNSSIIDEIAEYALAPITPPKRPPFLSESLTLFLTLTNVRGVPFPLSAEKGSAEEHFAYYADRIQFEMVEQGKQLASGFSKPLPVGLNSGAWPLLKDAARATGAFPIFLAPRRIDRSAGDYYYSPWQSIASDPPKEFVPAWGLKKTDIFPTLNVDGGVTNNDPFELAHQFLTRNNPCAKPDDLGVRHNPQEADEANCAVLTVAPFPSSAAFDPDFSFEKEGSVIGILPNLFTALISQSRFQGETLEAVAGGESFSRFVLAPSDAPSEPALQCALLGAFGGFFERGFRAHDYQLGRRNCQKFLRDWFRLSVDNKIIEAGLARLNAAGREAVMNTVDPNDGTLPIIPLCGTAVADVPRPARATITSDRLDLIIDLAVKRIEAVAHPMLKSILGEDKDTENFVVRSALDIVISTWGKARLREVLEEKLGALVQG